MNIEYFFALTIITLGLYCLTVKKNLIKKIIGLGIITDGIHLFLISIGFKENGIAPIITNIHDIAMFNTFAVDPLPQALVLTSIVIDLSITALALTLAIYAFRHFRTLDTEKIRGLSG